MVLFMNLKVAQHTSNIKNLMFFLQAGLKMK
jgi:hypothetical protein